MLVTLNLVEPIRLERLQSSTFKLNDLAALKAKSQLTHLFGSNRVDCCSSSQAKL